MSKTNVYSTEQANNKPFKPVQLQDRLTLTVLCVVALVGLILILIHFAQPTPPGLSVESTRTKADSLSKSQLSPRQETASSPTLAVGASSSSPMISTSTTVPATQPRGMISSQSASTALTGDGLDKGGEISKTVHNALQPSQRPPSLSL